MTDTARDYQTLTTADTNGMDDLFIEDAQTVEGFANPSEQESASTEQRREQDAPLDAYISVEEAANRLNISARAIQKRLKRGTMKGVKVKVGAGERWLVDQTTCLEKADAPTVINFANPPAMDATWLEPGREPDANIAELDAYTGEQGRELDAYQADDFKDALIKDLQNKLEAASFRVGYLQHQVESQETQIKLLTDSQHKRCWWANFSGWFFKAGS
jgi:excisionase family DNA binding protein